MAGAIKILRMSIHALLQGYHFFAFVSAVLVFPFASLLLFSQASSSSSRVLRTLSSRLHNLFTAAGLPASSEFFSLLNLKFSQSLVSFLSTLPFTLTFLVLAKATVIQKVLGPPRPTASSSFRLCRWLAPTYIFNSFVLLSANAAVLSVFFLAFNALQVLRLSSDNAVLLLSAAGAVLYSIVLANTTVICSLATIVAAMQNCSGYLAILKACVLVSGREATAITVALPANLGMAAVEALFHYRVARPYLRLRSISPSLVGEACLISLMYSVAIVLDTIVNCKLYRSCDTSKELEPEEKGTDLQA
ncbi:uncharacterized protein M6B38_104460 [Iris pallida]|uniref:Transmembrane protein n=1 Tax=Iris pallida TaxID=29817 RepID=A0AAX6F2U1_IRIPA|nr:uncharacterized protein M6B38_104460 [Iris pallida]